MEIYVILDWPTDQVPRAKRRMLKGDWAVSELRKGEWLESEISPLQEIMRDTERQRP